MNILQPNKAPLIPKLRGHVAEFLQQRSLERLRILTSPTCVGFSTVAGSSDVGFSRLPFRGLQDRMCPRLANGPV